MSAAEYLADISQEFARSAFNGVSFNPEGRGDRMRESYAASLERDYEAFKAQAVKGGTLDLLDAEFARYRAGCAQRMRAYLGSSSRCVSSFIAGPSKFPAARMNKRADITHKRLGEYLDFQRRARKAIISTLRPDLAPIRSSDADAVERLEKELAQAEELQAFMVAANKIVRAFYKAGARDAASGEIFGRYLARLQELRPAISVATATALLEADCCGRRGFADYQLTNNSASIRRIKQRIEQISKQQAMPVVERQGAAARIEDDPPANRVRLFFPDKPAADVRAKLKKNGFRWAPSIGAWQAYRNSWSLATAREVAA